MSTSSAGAATVFAGSVLESFARAVREHASRDAVCGAGGALTFAELGARSGRLAALLRRAGAGPERSVAIALPRSAELLVGILGVLKTGAAFVPFDPADRPERIGAALHELGAVAVLTRSAIAEQIGPAAACETVLFDALDWERLGDCPPVAIHPETTAYTIFTSGSTGRPKRIAISHRSLAWFLRALCASGAVPREPGRVGWNASVAFDASVQQWVRVCRGDTIFVLDEHVRRDPAEFARYVAAHRLTDVDMTPSHAQVLLDELASSGARNVRLLVGGEAIPAPLWRALAELAAAGTLEASNMYGPTEATVDALWAPVTADRAPHLGTPLPQVGVQVLDEQLRPVRDGAGELCLSGPGLARCYTGEPGLTAARFVPDASAGDGSRMYRTGDRVARAADGCIEYLGRTDEQVKVRGHRVEPGAVEAVLAAHAGVIRAVVVYDGAVAGGALRAFLQLAPDADLAAVRSDGDARLADWMQPVSYETVASFPRTASGKIDRSALLDRSAAARTAQAPVRAERDDDARPRPLQELVAAVWTDVLGVAQVGADDDFFRLGGHSLAAMQVGNRLRARFGVRIPTRVVFEHRTLAAYSAFLGESLERAATARRS